MLVMTFGTFDRFHPGHAYYLREAKKLGDILLTIIARDATVVRIKGKQPRDSEEVRMNSVLTFGVSDSVVLGSLTDPYQILLENKPDILCFGYDQNSFNNEKLEKFCCDHHLNPQIVRLSAFNPEKWKSSLL